jgi:hypothetical protein
MHRSPARPLAVAVVSLIAVVAVGCGDTTNVTTVVKTVASESSAQAPTVTHHSARARQAVVAPSPYKQCDAHISARRGTTTCAFAENVFYGYWTSGRSAVVRAYSPLTGVTYTTSCAAGASEIVCTAGDGGRVRFSRASIDAYSQSQADRYAASHELGPQSTPAPESDAGTDSSTADCDPAYEGACVPNDGSDYDCPEIDGTDFNSVGDDPDRLDADGDGIACES